MTRSADRGNATVLAAIGGAALLAVLIVALQIGGAVIARHRAESAADLAVLAGAADLLSGNGSGCDTAGSVAAANGATMVSCAPDGDDLLVAVSLPIRWGPVDAAAGARARAGPDADVKAALTDPVAEVDGETVRLPDDPQIPGQIRGAAIRAPTAGIARGIAAGLGQLGLPYVWGGGGDGGGPDDGCARGGGELNSCAGLVGFDCSGLTAFVVVSGGYPSPGGDSSTQRAGGRDVSYSAGRPGDIVGFPGHVAIFLGRIGGVPYILEASSVGVPVHVRPLAAVSKTPDPTLHRYWG